MSKYTHFIAKTQVNEINTSHHKITKNGPYIIICNTIADYQNIVVIDVRMEKMSDKIFVRPFWGIYNLADREMTEKQSTYSKETDVKLKN